MIRKRSYLAISISCALASGIYGVAQAQQAPRTSGALEEIVVTAQRKSENIQEVPIAVTALSASDLKDQRIETGANLTQAVPNMSFQPGAFAKPNFVIRGIGYQLVTSTGEAGVALHVNDAPLTISRIAMEDFFDVERIEVLRGPQGTLYGRNATAGVVNLKSALPDDSYQAMLSADMGNHSNRRLEGMLNIPIV
ncbi:MAG TPA: TonB-dependent receptor plug domain-containing protein, partial [Steroidobacteraceae bacterium]|nr:TonB-dependent receptor plug domain-containing protein [Steroidobacteraceae bacterium]